MCVNLVEVEYQNQNLNHISDHYVEEDFAARLRQYLMIIGWYRMLDVLEDWTYFYCSSQKSFMKGGTSVWSHPAKREPKSALSSGLTFSLFNSKAVFIIASSDSSCLHWSRCSCNASFNLTRLVRVTGAYNLAGLSRFACFRLAYDVSLIQWEWQHEYEVEKFWLNKIAHEFERKNSSWWTFVLKDASRYLW